MKAGTCKHFNGVSNTCCKAGVRYKAIQPEGHGFPCFRIDTDNRPKLVCDLYAEPTAEDIAARQAQIEASMERHRKAAPVVMEFRKANKGKSNRTAVPCPVCGAGRLHMTISGYNGHVHGKCETPGCLSWME